MKFIIVIAIATMAITDVATGKFAAVQQRVVTNQFSNSLKSAVRRAPSQISNFFKTKASSINQAQYLNGIQPSSISASPNLQYQTLTQQPIGFVQNAKNQFVKGFNKISQKPLNSIAQTNVAAAQSNIASAVPNNIGFASNNIAQSNIAQQNIKAASIQGIQTESFNPIKQSAINQNIKAQAINQNIASQPISQNLNKNLQSSISQNIQAPLNENLAANNAPKASAWSQKLSQSNLQQQAPLNANIGSLNNAANTIVNSEGSSLGIQATEQANKIQMGFAAL